MTAPLWTPSPERIELTQLTGFRRYAEALAGRPLADYDTLHAWSIANSEAFWSAIWDFCGVIGERGERRLSDGELMPGARFFPDARLNFAENLLGHPGSGDALIFRDERGARRSFDYPALHAEVMRVAAALRADGVEAGDRVAAFLPNIPEAVIAMLATTSIGAIWSSCSPDFGVRGVLDRFSQIEPSTFLFADGYVYGGKTHHCYERASEIVANLPSLRRVVTVGNLSAPLRSERRGPERTSPTRGITDDELDGSGIRHALSWEAWTEGRKTNDHFEHFAFDHPVYILYSSGTTGAPKCIVHGAGGTLLQHAKEQRLQVDLRPGDPFFYYTTTGWMMWNWLVSGLSVGASVILYDGSPFAPTESALFDLAEEESVAVFGVSAKYLDAAGKARLRPCETHRFPELRTVLSTGSPLVPEGFRYVYDAIKDDVCLSSIAGGTDIVSCFLCGNPNGAVWPGECQAKGLGMAVEVFDERGKAIRGEAGELVCTRPFPSMPVGFWNDPDGERYHSAYFERYPGVWHHGDYAAVTEHGGVAMYGRSDATLNPGGVRIGTAEVYRQVEQLDAVLESLVIGQTWDDDQRVILFVRLRDGLELDDALRDAIRKKIRDGATPRHVPARIIAVGDIPRTRSGKIVEIAVRDVVHGRAVKNREALDNPEALELFRDLAELSN